MTQATHPQSTGEAMTSRAKELLVQILDAEWSVEKHSLWINADGVPKGPMHAADVRGWGFLTGRGHAHALDSESAFLIQKAIAHNIVDSHNAYRTPSSENARLSQRVKVLEAALGKARIELGALIRNPEGPGAASDWPTETNEADRQCLHDAFWILHEATHDLP